MPFSQYGEVRPPICRLKNGTRREKKQDSLSDLLPGLVWYVLRGAGRLPSPEPTSPVKVSRPCSWHRGAHAKQWGDTVTGHLALLEGTGVETADGAWKRDAPPGEYQIGGERPRRLSLPRSEAPETFKKKRGTTESITPTPLLRG